MNLYVCKNCKSKNVFLYSTQTKDGKEWYAWCRNCKKTTKRYKSREELEAELDKVEF